MSTDIEVHNGDQPERRRDDKKPWEKRTTESLRAFTAFAFYRDLGYFRTHAKVAEGMGISLESVRGWSSDHDWRERVELFEVERDRRRLEAEMSEQEAARRAEAIAARAMLRKGLQRLQGDEEAGVEAINVNDLDASEMVKLVSEGVRIQRLALGMPTDFSKGALHMSFQEVGALVKELVSGLIPLIPPENHQQAFLIVRQISRTGGQG